MDLYLTAKMFKIEDIQLKTRLKSNVDMELMWTRTSRSNEIIRVVTEALICHL